MPIYRSDVHRRLAQKNNRRRTYPVTTEHVTPVTNWLPCSRCLQSVAKNTKSRRRTTKGEKG